VDAEILQALQARGFIPVVAPVGASPDGESLNINADTVAGKLAESLQAEKLLLLTDVEGIQDGEGRRLSSLAVSEAQRLIGSGVIAGGMIPKVECCLEALAGGVRMVHILDGRVRHAPLLELFTDEGIGTEVHRDHAAPRNPSSPGAGR